MNTASVRNFALRVIKTLALPLVVYLFFKILRPDTFGSPAALYIIAQQTTITLIISLGICCSMAIGIWDFSPGAIVTLAALISGYYCSRFGLAGLILSGITAGLLFGLIDAVLYSALKIPSVVVTIGFLLVYESLGTVYKGGKGFSITRAQAVLGSAPWIFLITGALIVIMYLLYNKTKFGLHVRAVGNGEFIAKTVGINPAKVKFSAFFISGIFFGIAGIMMLSYSTAIAPEKNMATMSITFDAMMGVFIGFALSGVCNPVIGIVIGSFCMKLLSAGLVAVGVNGTWQKVIVGLFLLFFLCFAQIKELVRKALPQKAAAL
ncbi:MAG: ABC transporter permease [Treponema sp.]|nr:ABC transporter permease [Treponema sp.]